MDELPYDTVLLVSFGGPEGPDEVMPFLRRVVAGRGVPDERLAAVAEHYLARGGVSPINAQNRALVRALAGELERRGLAVPVRLANRNSEPFLVDVMREEVSAGRERLLVVLTSGYASYSSCRQYRENLAEAVAALRTEPASGAGPVELAVDKTLVVDKVEPWFTLPGFLQTHVRHVSAALSGLTPTELAATVLLHVTHSIPTAMNDASGPPEVAGAYVAEHDWVRREVMRGVTERVGTNPVPRSELVFCSRSGPPRQPWLEPDVRDRIHDLAAEGVERVVLVPIGFASDHMEVINDLDAEAVAAGRSVGIEVVRTPTPGTAPEFVSGLVDLIVERGRAVVAPATGAGAGAGATNDPAMPLPAACVPGCCANLRGPRPALCGQDVTP